MPHAPLISRTIADPVASFVTTSGGVLSAQELSDRLGKVVDDHGEAHVSLENVAILFEQLSRDLAMPDFGLRYARAYPLGGTGALGYLLTQSQNLRSAVLAMGRYLRIIADGINATCDDVPGGAKLTWSYPADLSCSLTQFNAFAAALVVCRLRSCLSSDWHPRLVQFSQKEPVALDSYRAMFGPKVSFGQQMNCLTFSDINLDRPNFAADSRLFGVVQKLADILLEERKSKETFSVAVANVLVDIFGVSTPSLSCVADKLKMSSRTVQRRLADEGTTFDAVLDSTRRSVGNRLLTDTQVPMTDIAFMLGFSELSAFTRAARRWYGVPPRKHRDASQT